MTSETAAERTARYHAEEAAAALVVVRLLAAPPRTAPAARSFWGDPAHRLGVRRPGPHSWWLSASRR